MKMKHTQHGFIFITAIIALAVMVVIGVSFAGHAATQLSAARKDLNALHQIATADAGAYYVRWLQKWSPEETGATGISPTATISSAAVEASARRSSEARL